ncbi:NUDIX hydrolase [Methylophaga lonarensis]|uniref:NUDIX hydrolase n=1 Tax=Methylophaga lonarensis TaxID=999151 RepID=UPI003D2BF9DC
MISFAAGGHHFNLRAAAVIVDRGKVLLHKIAGDNFWSVPGGRVEPGETAAQAVIREILEETGEQAQCGQLLWVAENFFEYHGSQHHEIGLYFNVQLPPHSRLLALEDSIEFVDENTSMTYSWLAIAQLPSHEVRPSLLFRALTERDTSLRHYVHYEDGSQL